MVKFRVHGASQTSACQLLVELGLPNNFLEHAITLLLRNQILLMPHHVTAFDQLHQYFWFGNFVGVSHPCVKYEGKTYCGTKTVDEHSVEGRRRET